MHIVYLSPEVWPFIRVGGLSDVAHDLPLALGARGHQVEIITPKPRLAPGIAQDLEQLDLTLDVPVGMQDHRVRWAKADLGPGVRVWLADHESLFDREGLYGNEYGEYQDNAERFILLCRAGLELVVRQGWPVDVVHANDWTTALTALYMRSLYAGHANLDQAASLLTIHNLGCQGIFWHYDMPLTGLGWEYFTPEMVEFYGKINFLKAGLVSADLISTVSPSYAREIQGPEMGFGLEGVLRARSDRLAAALNGIDYEQWNPAQDPYLAANYDSANMGLKLTCRQDLRRAFGLSPGERPVVAVTGRLQDRKGLDLISATLDSILDLGLDLAVHGSGDDHHQRFLLERAEASGGRVAVRLGYDPETMHKLVAGADMLLAPNRYEPCGLHQLQALRYGTVPVVRDTGGLADTVRDHQPGQDGTGFKFGPYDPQAMLGALDRAMELMDQAEAWNALRRRAMAQDFSWRTRASEYELIYQRAMDAKARQEGS